MKIIKNKTKIIYILIIGLLLVAFVMFKIQNKITTTQKFYNEFRQLYDDINNKNYVDIEKIKKELNDEERNSEALTLVGIKEYKDNNIENAKDKLNLSIENINETTNYLSVFYTHTYLFKIYKNENNYEEAKVHLIDAFEAIPPIAYNGKYIEMSELIVLTYDIELFRNIAIDEINKIISHKEYVKIETELYLRDKLKTLYILSNRYAEATNTLIDSIIMSKEIDSTYRQGDFMISLGIVISELGGFKAATDLIEDALKLEIDYEYKNAHVKTFGYLNLAYIQFYYHKEVDKAMETLSHIEEYREVYPKEHFRDIEIYKLIYEANCYIINLELDLAKESLDKASKLLEEDKQEYYMNKQIELSLGYARYFHKKENYKESLKIYEKILEELKLSNNKGLQRNVLSEMISLTEDMGKDEYYKLYTKELLKLTNEIESFKYHDYSVYIANSVEEKKKTEHNYNQDIKMIKILSTSIILILIFYIYTSKKIKTLKYSSEYDGLTNIYNRKKFDIDYNKLLRNSEYFTCIIIDIDNFKKINDTFGHGFGDIVLKKLSKEINSLLPKNYNLYRYGGEEFVVLGVYENEEEVINISEKMRRTIEEMTWKENTVVTVSVGVAFSKVSKEGVLKASDKNLYKAKNSGKNKVVY